jgi:hypothetical protein
VVLQGCSHTEPEPPLSSSLQISSSLADCYDLLENDSSDADPVFLPTRMRISTCPSAAVVSPTTTLGSRFGKAITHTMPKGCIGFFHALSWLISSDDHLAKYYLREVTDEVLNYKYRSYGMVSSLKGKCTNLLKNSGKLGEVFIAAAATRLCVNIVMVDTVTETTYGPPDSPLKLFIRRIQTRESNQYDRITGFLPSILTQKDFKELLQNHPFTHAPFSNNPMTKSRFKNVVTKKIVGDGNCLFRAFSDFVTGTQELHKTFREAAVNELVSHPDRYAEFGDEANPLHIQIEDMGIDNSWADILAIAALSNAAEIGILVVAANFEHATGDTHTAKPWLILKYDGNHYERILHFNNITPDVEATAAPIAPPLTRTSRMRGGADNTPTDSTTPPLAPPTTSLRAPFVFRQMSGPTIVPEETADCSLDDFMQQEEDTHLNIDIFDVSDDHRLQLIQECYSLHKEINAIAIQGLEAQTDVTYGINPKNKIIIVNMLAALLIKECEVNWTRTNQDVIKHGLISNSARRKTASVIVHFDFTLIAKPQARCRLINYVSGHPQNNEWKNYATCLLLDPADDYKWVYIGSLGPLPKNDQILSLCKNQLEYYARNHGVLLSAWPDNVKLTLNATPKISSRMVFLNLYVAISPERDQHDSDESFLRSSSVKLAMELFNLTNTPTATEILGYKVMKCSNCFTGDDLTLYEPITTHIEVAYITIDPINLLEFLWVKEFCSTIRALLITAEHKTDVGYNLRLLLNYNTSKANEVVEALRTVPNNLARSTDAKISSDIWGEADWSRLYAETSHTKKGSGGRTGRRPRGGRAARGSGRGRERTSAFSYSQAASNAESRSASDLIGQSSILTAVNREVANLRDLAIFQSNQITEMRQDNEIALRYIADKVDSVFGVQIDIRTTQEATHKVVTSQHSVINETRNLMAENCAVVENMSTSINASSRITQDAATMTTNMASIMSAMMTAQNTLLLTIKELTSNLNVSSGEVLSEEPGTKHPRNNV